MSTWLLTWNPQNWEWATYAEDIENTKKGIKYKDKWSCINTNVQVGDRVYLIKLGEKPRGIIASGYAVSESYKAPHYNSDKAAEGVMISNIDVEFDRIVDYRTEQILSQEILKKEFKDQQWSPQGSGIEIKDLYVNQLDVLWLSVINNSSSLLDRLKAKEELIPDTHDGSYELMRETIRAYSHVSNFNLLDYLDLNTVYLMAVGTWKHSVEQKKKTVMKSHLPQEDKEKLSQILDRIYQNAVDIKYSNKDENGKFTFGMFGTGFYSFQRTTDNRSAQGFIRMCTEIQDMDDDTAIFDRTAQILNNNFKGMKAASASAVLHCLKPYTFPILNSNMGSADIFKALGIGLNKRENIATYIENCRKIKAFRDQNLPFKNYRILDMEAWDLDVKEGKVASEIDFDAIENFLLSYAGMNYIKQDKAGDESDAMSQVSEIGINARNQFIHYGNRVISNFNEFVAGTCSGWVNQGRIIPDYLWIELKKRGKENIPSSISLSINKVGNEIILSARVEARDAACKSKEDYDRHNIIITMPSEPGLDLYYYGENKKGEYIALGSDRNNVIERYKAGEFKKIQLLKNINGSYEASRTEEIISDTCQAVKILMPYYEEIIKGTDDESKVNVMNKNMILYGPPGTGKTYNTVRYAVAICDNVSLLELEKKPYEEVLKRYNELKNKEHRVAFTTFHQSYGYEEFIEGIRPVIMKKDAETSTGDVKYEFSDGVFKEFCIRAKEVTIKSSQDNGNPYVFIIDEINRGNISKIFGELITLIEKNKRKGTSEAASAILPYTKEEFSVPNNVYILGTMNTADRSIALMDTALRRRFEFLEMMPQIEVLSKLGIEDVEGINIPAMLKAMNERIEYLYDREHTIGHAYFTGLKDDPSVKSLAGIFSNSIIPLLQEYFYEDYSKIQLVLGDNAKSADAYKFILDEEIKVKSVFKGNPDIDLPERKYAIQEDAFMEPESYKQIY